MYLFKKTIRTKHGRQCGGCTDELGLEETVGRRRRRNRPMHTIIKIFGHSGGLNVKKKEPALGSAAESVLEGMGGGGAARQPRLSRFFRTKK